MGVLVRMARLATMGVLLEMARLSLLGVLVTVARLALLGVLAPMACWPACRAHACRLSVGVAGDTTAQPVRSLALQCVLRHLLQLPHRIVAVC